MPVNLQGLGISRRQNLQRGVAFEGPRQIPPRSVDLGDDGLVGQPRANGPRDVEGRRALGNALDASVRKGDLNFTHGYFQRSRAIGEATSAPADSLPTSGLLRSLQKRSVFEFHERLLKLLLRVHHNRAIPRHRFLQRLSRDQEKPDPLLTRLHHDLVAAVKKNQRAVAGFGKEVSCSTSRPIRSARQGGPDALQNFPLP